LDAYDQFLRGIAKFHQSTEEANTQALTLFSKAIELDPEFAAAYGMAGWCYVRRKANGWMTNFSRAQEVAEAERLARLAIALGKDDAVAMCTGGYTLAYVAHDLDAGGNSIDRALVLNPNLAWAWLYSGWNKGLAGRCRGRDCTRQPFDPPESARCIYLRHVFGNGVGTLPHGAV
jgi:tetratricopeptide (TPR) repeat protein